MVEQQIAEASEYREDDIPIANLKLDELNFRTDEVDSQRAAIQAMIKEQGKNLIVLAEHYLQHGRLTPGERLLVIPDDEEGENGFYVVMEGNRRTTVMKLLEQPSLALETAIHARFAVLAREFAKRPRRTLPCVILPSRESALTWVEVKHSTGLGGAGVEKWGAPATARFNEFIRGKIARWRAVLRFLDEQGVDTQIIRAGIQGKTTAVTRVFDTKAMRDTLGVRFATNGAIEFENGEIAAGTSLLHAMMNAMANPHFSTNDVHSFDDRVEFIEEFCSLSVKAQNQISNSSWNSDMAPTGTISNTGNDDIRASTGIDHYRKRIPTVRKHPRDRETLAPKDRGNALRIDNDRLNQLYHEARTLKVEQHTAIAAVLIRVFLELSCEQFLAENTVALPTHIASRKNGRAMDWHSFGIKLREKIENAVNFVDPNNSHQFSEIRRGLKSQDHLHSPENLHGYVHGLKAIPSGRDLIIIWDRYHPLFVRIFN